MHEPASLDRPVGLQLIQSPNRTTGQGRIGMEEEQPFAFRKLSARVHLQSTAFRSGEYSA